MASLSSPPYIFDIGSMVNVQKIVEVNLDTYADIRTLVIPDDIDGVQIYAYPAGGTGGCRLRIAHKLVIDPTATSWDIFYNSLYYLGTPTNDFIDPKQCKDRTISYSGQTTGGGTRVTVRIYYWKKV